MASGLEFVQFACGQIEGTGSIRFRKMFGEYMVYVNDKPILLICDDIVYIKILDCVKDILLDAETGVPYEGSKPHYILDIDDAELSRKVVSLLEPVTPLPKPRKKKLPKSENE